jgi:hypothetical protein
MSIKPERNCPSGLIQQEIWANILRFTPEPEQQTKMMVLSKYMLAVTAEARYDNIRLDQYMMMQFNCSCSVSRAGKFLEGSELFRIDCRSTDRL